LDKTVKLLVVILVCLFVVIGVIYALTSIGIIKIGYKITPSSTQAPTMTPNPINLDLGTIPSGSSGPKDFGKVGTLSLPVSYEITFTLDTSSASDFAYFTVYIYLYPSGSSYYSYSFLLTKSYPSDYETVSAGNYDIQVKIDYQAVSVTSDKTGTVNISVSYPG
jgi:hypothetical protein